MKEQSTAENVFFDNGQLGLATSKKKLDIKIVKKKRDRQGDYFFKKEAKKREQLSGETKNLLKTVLGQDVFSREEQSIRFVDEKEESHKENFNNKKGKNIRGEFLKEKKKIKTMEDKKREMPVAGNTIQEQLAARKDAIEKIVVPGNPGENSTNNHVKAEQNAGEAITEKVAGSQNKVANERIAELGQKLATAYKKSKNSRYEYERTKSIKDELFEAVQQRNPNRGPAKLREETVDLIEKTKNQVRSEEKERKEKFENLKTQLEETYKIFYEDYLNKGQEAPKEIYDAIQEIGKELRSSARFRGEASELVEQTKEKYKKDDKSKEEKTKREKKEKQEFKKAEIEGKADKKFGYTKEMVEVRAAEIEQRRLSNQPGFEWEKVDALLRGNKIEPGTIEAKDFMAEWDRRIARQELAKENKQENIIKTDNKLELKEEEKKIDYLKITSKKDAQKQKAELPPEKIEIFEKFGQEFYNALKEGASWEGYDEENKRITLEIQTKVFLTNQLKRMNLAGEGKVTEMVEFLVRGISK